MIDQVNEFSLTWGEAVFRASWQGAVLAFVAWVICRAWKKMPPIMSCGIWLIVFLKLAVSVTPLALSIPLLPAKQALSLSPGSVEPGDGLIELSGMINPPAQLSVSSYLLLAWGLGVFLLVVVALVALLGLKKKVREVEPISEPGLIELVADLSSRVGLRKAPQVVISSQETNAMTIGIVKPVILIPHSTLDSCTREELRFILAHELAHIKRGDAWLALLPQLVSALFFFHPAVWIANREFELSREAACDQTAVRTLGASQDAYGRLLLKLSSPGEDGNPPFAFGISSHFRILSRRISMLKDTSTSNLTSTRRPLVVIALAGVLVTMPWTLVHADPAPMPKHPAIQPGPISIPEPPQGSKPVKNQKPKSKPNAVVRRTQAFVVDLKYAKAESVKAEVLKRTKMKNTSLVTDSRKNQIVVVGFLPESENIAKLVKSLDRKPAEKVEPPTDQPPSLTYSTQDSMAIALSPQINAELLKRFSHKDFKMTLDPIGKRLTIQGSVEVIEAIPSVFERLKPAKAPPKVEMFTGKIPVTFHNAADLGKKLVEEYEPKYNRSELRILVDPATNQLVIEAFAEGLLRAVRERAFALDKPPVKKPTNPENMVIRRFKLKVVDAERGFGKFREVLSEYPSINFCSYDPTDNSLVVRADKDDMEAIGKSIEKIDKKGS